MKNLYPIMISIVVTFTLSGCIFTPPAAKTVSVVEPSVAVSTEPASWKQIEALSPEALMDEEDPIMRIAKQQIGVPYVTGGVSSQGFDCSGFVYFTYIMGVGRYLPRTALAQSTYGEIVERVDLFMGDLVFFDTSDGGNVNHSGIYIGDGYFIHASSGKGEVTISNLDKGFYKKAFNWGTRVGY